MELEMVQTWEKYDAMLTLEKRVYKNTLDKIYECDDLALKILYRKKLKISKEMVKALKVVIKEFKEIASFRNLKKLNKNLEIIDRCVRQQLEVDKIVEDAMRPEMDEFNEMLNGEGVVEDLGLVPVIPTDDDEFVEV